MKPRLALILITLVAVPLFSSDPFAIAAEREFQALLPVDEEAIKGTFNNYELALESLNASAMLPHCHLPFMFVSSKGVRVMTSPADVNAFLAEMVKTLRNRSYARSEVTDLRVKQMSRGIALVIVSRIRYNTEGERLEWVGETYTFRKTTDGWKIVVAAVHNPITPD
jgi:ketosteroid isomerase-like protein